MPPEIAKGGPLNLLIFLAILFCGCLAGFAAGKLTAVLPLQHGAAAAATMYLAIQLAGALRRVVSGDDLSNPLGWVFLALLLATCGMAGAALEQRSKPLREGRAAIDDPTIPRENP